MAPSRKSATACALVVAALAATACGKPSKDAGTLEPAREGLAVPIAGIHYNVFITRQLNLREVPDTAYYKGPEPKPDETLYGIFLQACNEEEEGKPKPTAEHFKVVDNQGNEFEPEELPEDNEFAYHPKALAPLQCIPEVGSVAQQGPTAGSMLLFRLPLTITENRPLELEIEAPYDVATGKREVRKFELDL